MISIQSLLGGNDGDSPVDSNAPQGERTRLDAYNPAPAHKELLEEVRQDAEAEAIRHAEAMANRVFPVVEQAESIAAQRIAALGAAYAAARSQYDAEVGRLDGQLPGLELQLKTTEEALEAEGVGAEELGLAPIGDRMVSLWQVALALGIGAIAGLLGARLNLAGAGLVLLVLAAGALVAGVLRLRIGSPESARVTGLRRNRRREAREREKLLAAKKENEARIAGLQDETLRLIEVETAFAKQMVTTFESAASSALPVGSLGQGERAIRRQREPQVRFPAWAEELEAER